MGYAPSVNFNDLTLFLGLCATGVATSGSHTLSSVSFGTVYNPRTGITFEPSDVGMPIAIVGGGAVNSLMPPVYMVQGSLFHTTIDSYVSPTEVTLTDAPVTSFANTGFANIILYRPCPMTSDVATLASGAAQFQYNSSIAPGTSDTMQFTTLSSLGGSLGTDNPYVDRFGAPQLGQPVYLHSSVTGDVFGGYIDSLTTSSMPGVPGTPYCWSAQCASWMGLAKRRQVPPANPQSFTSADADVAFTAIVLDYLSDDGVAVSAPSGLPQINLACAVGANVGQLLDQVVSLVSTPDTAYYWNTNPWRTFILATRGAVNAPWDVVDGSDLFAGDTPNCQSITETHNQMANAVYGIGKQTILNTLNASFNGNGTATTFNVPEPVGTAPTITLNDSSQTVGALGSTGSDWYWSQGSSVITQDSGGTVLVSTDILLVSYSPLVSAVAQNFNVGSLQSLQAIEGTSANYDYSFTIDNPILPADLLAMCTAYEIEYGLPAQTVSFYTLRPGLAVGQLQSITLLEAGISGSFLIATIQMSTMNNVIVWQYTAFGGANIGNAITALTQLINRQEASGIVAPSTPITPSTGASSVQQTPLGNQFTPAVFPISVAKGDLLVVVLTCGQVGAGPLPSPTDTLGNSWTLAASYNGSVIPPYGNQEQCGIYWSISTAAGADTVSIGGGVVAQFYAFEFSGVDTSSPVDVLSAGGTAQPLTTTKTYDLIITGMAGPGTTSPTVTSPETLVAFSGAPEPPLPSQPAGIAVAQTIRDATGSFTSSLTPASPDAYQAFVSVAFAAAPTAPPAQTTNVQANPTGTVTHSTGALTAGLPVIGNGGGDVVAGAAGQLVPVGGSPGQVLEKNSGADYDAGWHTPTGGSGVGPGCCAYNSGTQSLPSGDSTLTFDTNRWDTGSIHSTIVNTDRFTAPSAGYYLATGNIVTNNANQGIAILSIRVNGSAELADQGAPAGSGHGVLLNITAIVHLSAGDYVVFHAFLSDNSVSTISGLCWGQLTMLSATL